MCPRNLTQTSYPHVPSIAAAFAVAMNSEANVAALANQQARREKQPHEIHFTAADGECVVCELEAAVFGSGFVEAHVESMGEMVRCLCICVRT